MRHVRLLFLFGEFKEAQLVFLLGVVIGKEGMGEYPFGTFLAGAGLGRHLA